MKDLQVSKDNLKVINVLRKINKFSEFTDKDIRSLLNVGRICEYEPSEVIIKEGALDSWVYFLIKGALAIEKDGHKIAMLRRCGDMFGEMGVIDGSPRSATIRADSKVMILEFNASLIEEKLKTKQINFCYMIYRIFAEVLASRLRNTTDDNIRVMKENSELKKQISVFKHGSSTTLIGRKDLGKTFSHMKTLIVDEKEATRKILRSLLRELKFDEVIAVADAASALMVLQGNKIDLLISEWDLSGLSGLDLLKRVRATEKIKNIPCILIIDETGADRVKLAEAAGVNKCLAKPFNANGLYNTISEAIE
nr:response regulator [Desulfobulbaceae bacterium]